MKEDNKQRPSHEAQAEVKGKPYVPPRMRVFKLDCQLLAASAAAECDTEMIGSPYLRSTAGWNINLYEKSSYNHEWDENSTVDCTAHAQNIIDVMLANPQVSLVWSDLSLAEEAASQGSLISCEGKSSMSSVDQPIETVKVYICYQGEIRTLFASWMWDDNWHE